MSPEALARLREALRIFDADGFGGDDPLVDFNDLRALLDAYDTAMRDGRTVVECADEMRQQWAEIEERLTEERDTARAEGVAAERARVVAALEKRAWMLPKAERQALLSAVDRIKRGLHVKEGER